MNQHLVGPSYSDTVSSEHRKKYGQFFTPPNVASLMADWVISGPNRRVLDPALGTGALAEACLAKEPSTVVTAFEKDATVLRFRALGVDEKFLRFDGKIELPATGITFSAAA